MKAVILAVPLLMLALLTGCTDQTQMTGPVTTTSNVLEQALNVPLNSEKFEDTVIGPGGVKFVVSGSVDYTLLFDGPVYTLGTIVNAEISVSGAASSWNVASGKNISSVLNDDGFDFVSEKHDFEFIAEKFPVYRLILDYTIDFSGLKVTGVKVGRADVAEGV